MDEINPLDMLVNRYLDNEMPDNEKIVFEQRLSSDPLLNTKVERSKLARDAVMYRGLHQRVSEMRKIFEQQHLTPVMPVNTRPAKVRKLVRFSLIAASVLFAFVMIRGLFFAPASSQQVYDDVYVGYQLGNTRSGGTSLNSLEQAYQQKKYAEVARLAQESFDSEEDQLLLGISLLNIGNSKKAILVLETLIKNPGTKYLPDVEFYLGLSYLKAGLPRKSYDLLSKINATPGHPYHKLVSTKNLEQIQNLF